MNKRTEKQPDCTPASCDMRMGRHGLLRMSDGHEDIVIPIASSNSSRSRKFENLSIHFPEGPVINLRFRREQLKNISADQRQETYRLVDIGIGRGFAADEAEAIEKIEEEHKPHTRAARMKVN